MQSNYTKLVKSMADDELHTAFITAIMEEIKCDKYIKESVSKTEAALFARGKKRAAAFCKALIAGAQKRGIDLRIAR